MPSTCVTQIIAVVVPATALATLIFFLNVFVPSSHDVRVLNDVARPR